MHDASELVAAKRGSMKLCLLKLGKHRPHTEDFRQQIRRIEGFWLAGPLMRVKSP